MSLREDYADFVAIIPEVPESTSAKAKEAVERVINLVTIAYYNGIVSGVESGMKVQAVQSLDDVTTSVDDLRFMDELSNKIKEIKSHGTHVRKAN